MAADYTGTRVRGTSCCSVGRGPVRCRASGGAAAYRSPRRERGQSGCRCMLARSDGLATCSARTTACFSPSPAWARANSPCCSPRWNSARRCAEQPLAQRSVLAVQSRRSFFSSSIWQPGRGKYSAACFWIRSTGCCTAMMFCRYARRCRGLPAGGARRALRYRAAAVILAHNHPSGVATPSSADRRITERLRDALALIDVRVLDHIVVGRGDCYSFAENGLL
jgi:DNA repair protein RadC